MYIFEQGRVSMFHVPKWVGVIVVISPSCSRHSFFLHQYFLFSRWLDEQCSGLDICQRGVTNLSVDCCIHCCCWFLVWSALLELICFGSLNDTLATWYFTVMENKIKLSMKRIFVKYFPGYILKMTQKHNITFFQNFCLSLPYRGILHFWICK